jgi:hypothetical protein
MLPFLYPATDRRDALDDAVNLRPLPNVLRRAAAGAILMLLAPGCVKDGAPTRGASADTKSENVLPAKDSLYGTTDYKVVAALFDTRNKSSVPTLLRVFGAPKSFVRMRFAKVIEQYEAELAAANRRVAETAAEIEKTSSELDAAEKSLTQEYAEMRPDELDDGPSEDDRDPLLTLSKVRAEKSRIDRWYKKNYAERIEPIKLVLKSLYRKKINETLDIEFIKASFKNRLFGALANIPETDRKVWATNRNGEATITISNDEPWAVWSETEHREITKYVTRRRIQQSTSIAQAIGQNKYEIDTDITVDEETYPELKTTKVRWLLHVPDDIDANKRLSLDGQSAFDLQDIVIDSSGSDGQYLKAVGAR